MAKKTQAEEREEITLQVADKLIHEQEMEALAKSLLGNLPLEQDPGEVEEMQKTQVIHDAEMLRWKERLGSVNRANASERKAREALEAGLQELAAEEARAAERKTMQNYSTRLNQMNSDRDQKFGRVPFPLDDIDEYREEHGQYDPRATVSRLVRHCPELNGSVIAKVPCNPDVTKNGR